jgi:hypothetical protein
LGSDSIFPILLCTSRFWNVALQLSIFGHCGATAGGAYNNATIEPNGPSADLRLMFEVEIKKRGRSRWEWWVFDSSRKMLMSGWENSRPAARYHSARALFLLLAHPQRSNEEAG